MLYKMCKQDLSEDAFEQKRNGKLKRYCTTCCRELSRQAKNHARERPKRLYNGGSYQSRNLVLQELGFANYSEYLQSELWKSIRKNVYAQKGSSCYLCGDPATALHHNRYHRNDLVGVRTKYIKPICSKCHHEIEFSNGKKARVRQAASAFRRKRKAHLQDQQQPAG